MATYLTDDSELRTIAEAIRGVSGTNETLTFPNGFVNALSGVNTLSSDIKIALLACFSHVAWTDSNGQSYYNALDAALNPPANLTSISAVYTQSHTVYTEDSLNVLKSDLIVTAHYDDSSSTEITSYTLSGTLTEGNSTITVSFDGKTDTFSVTVTPIVAELSSISAVLNLNGAIIRTDNTLNDLKQYLTITALYSDNTSTEVSENNYILSGTLALNSDCYDASNNTITVTYSEKTTTFQVKVYNSMTIEKVTLPSGYTQLVMISSENNNNTNSDCYINTGITASSIDHVKYGVQAAGSMAVNGTNWHVLSSLNTWYPYFRQGNSGARNFQAKTKQYGGNSKGLTDTWESNTNYILEAYPDIKINGVLSDTMANTVSDPTILYIAAKNSSDGTASQGGKIRYYFIKMYNDQNELIYNFVPCKNSSDVVGFYDTINEEFYSSNGAIAFVAGEVLS